MTLYESGGNMYTETVLAHIQMEEVGFMTYYSLTFGGQPSRPSLYTVYDLLD